MKQINDQSLLLYYLNRYELGAIFSDEVKKNLSLYQFHSGEILCSKGDTIERMFFIVKGKVKIFTTSIEGKTLIVRFKTPLSIIGDVEYVKRTNIFNTVEAVTEGVAIGVRFEDLRKMETNQIELLQFLLEIVTQKFYTESHATSLNMLYSVEVRLASYLLSLSSDGEGSMFHKEMRTSTITEIADLIGTSYRHLNRVIQKLCMEEIIQRKKGTLYIKDLPRLRERAAGNIYE
ncbi:Crp/Fnr family transcriptional regulator [Heyndrickxia sp. NPDC080065]|uniref:Crp/Fnr family transcriptional regulator n=1 Tax=Heyndrickxia sp. NPDC080065 TaxID=3390568 RepID=UPI003D06B7BF